jgi:transposase
MLKAFVATLKPKEAAAAVVRFETGPGEQMQVDWAVKRGKDRDPSWARGVSRLKSRTTCGDAER